MRFLLAAVLLGGCLWWIHQNGILAGIERTAQPGQPIVAIGGKLQSLGLPGRIQQAKPLSVPLLPAAAWLPSVGFSAARGRDSEPFGR